MLMEKEVLYLCHCSTKQNKTKQKNLRGSEKSKLLSKLVTWLQRYLVVKTEDWEKADCAYSGLEGLS